MKKKLIPFLLAAALLVVSCGEKPLEKEEITIYHATDIHYISPQLCDNSPRFVDMIATGDGKMTHYIEPITEAFTADVIRNKPDYLLIGGDITFNGEKQSHIDFAKKLKRIEDGGTQVLVIPGNHDVDYPFSYRYEGDFYYKTDRMLKEDFENTYTDFGLKQAYSRDKITFSYFYRLTDKITVLALDTNTTGTGICSDETVAWVEKEVNKLKEGTQLIVLTHQNLLNHFENGSYASKYTIINNRALINALNKKGVLLNLSGHIHTQHKYEADGITDIATESLAVMPYNYGIITCNSEKAEYQTGTTNIRSWVKENDIQDPNLQQFSTYSEEFYMNNQSGRSMEKMEESTLPDSELKVMADFFAELNIYYFSGTMDTAYDYLTTTEGYKLWCEKGEGLAHYEYVMARMAEGKSGIDHDGWEKSFN